MNATLVSPAISEQVIAFADLRGYHRQICRTLTPARIYEFLAEYYQLAQGVVQESDGQIIKFMGDSVLLVFPSADPRRAMGTLEKLKTAADLFLASAGHDAHLCVKAHVGTVAIGPLGEDGMARLDVCGLAVNETALLPAGEWSLSDELQKKLELN